jgi:hypothetical protein
MGILRRGWEEIVKKTKKKDCMEIIPTDLKVKKLGE